MCLSMVGGIRGELRDPPTQNLGKPRDPHCPSPLGGGGGG